MRNIICIKIPSLRENWRHDTFSHGQKQIIFKQKRIPVYYTLQMSAIMNRPWLKILLKTLSRHYNAV